MTSLRETSRSKKDKKKEHSYNSKNKNINLNKKYIIHPEFNNFTTSDNKTNRFEKNNTTSYISKNNKQISQNSVIMEKRNYVKIIKNFIHNKNTKEKEKVKKNSPLKYLQSIQNESDNNNKTKNEKELKILKLNSINKNKNSKLKQLLFKNNSISISYKNNIDKELNINIMDNDNDNLKNGFSFNKIGNKKIIKQKENKKIYNSKIKINNKTSNNSLQNEFNQYKQNTNKIIFDLKNKVEELEKTLYIYEEKQKNNLKIKELVKNKEFINAFYLAINLNYANEIYYIIKTYNFYCNENENEMKNYKLNSEILSKIIDIICNDINFCENLNSIIFFIKNNICENKIKIKNDSSKLLYSTLLNLYNKKNEFFLSELDINNIKYLIDYFKIK